MADAVGQWVDVPNPGAGGQWQDVPNPGGGSSSAAGDFVRGAASKLNPLNTLRDMADTLKAASDHPIDTALSVLAHPYFALKRAKEALDAGKPEEAAAHFQSALDPTGFVTEGSMTKAATPGQRAEGFGELLGAGLSAYLGAKAPDVVAAAAKPIVKAGAAIPPIPGAVQDIAGVVPGVGPSVAHGMSLLNRVTNAMRKIAPEASEEAPAATPPPLPISALPPARAPIWNGPPGRPATPPDLTPIPGKLPSGRVPGGPAIDPATGEILQNVGGGELSNGPVAPVNPRKAAFDAARAGKPNAPPPEAAPPASPAETPPPPSSPGTPGAATPPAPAGAIDAPAKLPPKLITQNQLAQYANENGLSIEDADAALSNQNVRVIDRVSLNRTLHAQVGDHETLSDIAKSTYKVDSLRKLSDEQMLELVDTLAKEQAAPAPGADSGLTAQMQESLAQARAKRAAAAKKLGAPASENPGKAAFEAARGK